MTEHVHVVVTSVFEHMSPVCVQTDIGLLQFKRKLSPSDQSALLTKMNSVEGTGTKVKVEIVRQSKRSGGKHTLLRASK